MFHRRLRRWLIALHSLLQLISCFAPILKSLKNLTLDVKKETSGSNALNEGMKCVFKKNTTFSDCCRYKTGLKLTTALFITVVSAVIVAVANRPKRHAAVVRPAGILCMVVTSISWSHFGENSSIINIFFKILISMDTYFKG